MPKKERRKLSALHWLWCYTGGRRSRLIAPVVTVVALLLFGGNLYYTSATTFDFTKMISGLIALAGGFWSVSNALTNSLVGQSPDAALRFQRRGNDPMEQIRSHFRYLMSRTEQPIAVFIDDLDRCKADYVVGLLESLQTLFNESKVVYVIAADRRWIANCFQQHYEKMGDAISEPGRPVGYLFLEKLIQLSVPVPAIPPETKRRYMQSLLVQDSAAAPPTSDTSARITELAHDYSAKTSQGEVIAEFDNSTESDDSEKELKRAAAIRVLSDQRFEGETHHRLIRFVNLIEANPRHMKLLVMAYGVYLINAVASGSHPNNEAERDQLAIWTMLSLRFPEIAEYLQEKPEAISSFLTQTADLPDELKDVAMRDDVNALLKGTGVGRSSSSEVVNRPLSERFIRKLTGHKKNNH